MAKKFIFLRAVDRTYKEQGQIYFACQMYAKAPKPTRDKIDRLCQEVGKQHARALKEFLISEADMQYISTKYYVSVPTLDRLRKAFYERW